MDTNQIFSLVNQVTSEAMGVTNISATDTQSLVSLGNSVLSSSVNTEAWLNTLLQRIGKTIISYRMYKNKLDDMVLNDFEYGAILQKISFDMPAAEKDQMFDLNDGDSVDHYVVAKPKVQQKLFVTRTPYQFHITTQRQLLKSAFLNESAMSGFIAGCFGQVNNRIELSLENLGRACLANFVAESNNEIKLVTNYNTANGTTLTPATAVFDPDFLRYAVKMITLYSKKITDMSKSYNDGTLPRFTPTADQRLRVISDFESALETVVQYSAFHEDMVRLNTYKELNFWQAEKEPMSIMVKRASDGTETTVNNIVAILHDRDALGMYKKDEEVLTTPVNAAAAYYNTYWHQRELWFNDLSENFVFFTLN